MGGGYSDKPDHGEAQAMLDLCTSVGARAVDLTLTNSAGDKEWFRRNLSLSELGRMLPAMLDDANTRKRNVIVRPHGPGVTFLQLDDLKAHQLPAVAFVEIETSPGNYQAWLALSGTHDREFCSRVRKGSGADIGASGATRIPGSINWKPDHAPEKTGRPHYPHVMIRQARLGRTTTAAELDQLGLVAPKKVIPTLSPARFEAPNLRKWPDYQYNLDRAKPNKTGDGLDLSGVDFVWCMTCSTWGFEEKDIIERLLEVSEHARLPDNGKPYAERTAKNAAHYIERSRQTRQSRFAR
jgi:hypothetical protein